jgi:hypothetical protein
VLAITLRYLVYNDNSKMYWYELSKVDYRPNVVESEPSSMTVLLHKQQVSS